MMQFVTDAERLAENVATNRGSLSEAERARIADACHRVLNMVEPSARAGVSLAYQNG